MVKSVHARMHSAAKPHGTAASARLAQLDPPKEDMYASQTKLRNRLSLSSFRPVESQIQVLVHHSELSSDEIHSRLYDILKSHSQGKFLTDAHFKQIEKQIRFQDRIGLSWLAARWGYLGKHRKKLIQKLQELRQDLETTSMEPVDSVEDLNGHLWLKSKMDNKFLRLAGNPFTDLELMQAFLDRGSNINHAYPHVLFATKPLGNGSVNMYSVGTTPLTFAALRGCPKQVQFLLDQGADPDALVNNPIPPLPKVLHFLDYLIPDHPGYKYIIPTITPQVNEAILRAFLKTEPKTIRDKHNRKQAVDGLFRRILAHQKNENGQKLAQILLEHGAKIPEENVDSFLEMLEAKDQLTPYFQEVLAQREAELLQRLSSFSIQNQEDRDRLEKLFKALDKSKYPNLDFMKADILGRSGKMEEAIPLLLQEAQEALVQKDTLRAFRAYATIQAWQTGTWVRNVQTPENFRRNAALAFFENNPESEKKFKTLKKQLEIEFEFE